MRRFLCSIGFGLAIGLASAARGAPVRDAVIVSGFDGVLVNQHPPDEASVLPPVAGPIYFYPQNDLEKGRKSLPPAPLVHAVAVYLSHNGYWVVPPGHTPTALIVLHWFSVRDEITHFGPPAQPVELDGPGGRGVVEAGNQAQTPPFVLISVFDFKAAQAKPQRIVKWWQMGLWLRVVRPTGEVRIGLPEVKAYLDPVPPPPKAAAKPANPPSPP
jgi:hypothetical protein